jgi:cytochrome P450
VCNVTDAMRLTPSGEDSYYQDPAGFFARLRESRPVSAVIMPGIGRAWVITRYADVRTALTDPRLTTDVRRWTGGGKSRPSEAVNLPRAHAQPQPAWPRPAAPHRSEGVHTALDPAAAAR